MGTNEQIARLILQQTWEEREMLADELNVDASKIGQWAKSMEAPEPAAQDDDGWIEWNGGVERPVHSNAMIEVRFKTSGNCINTSRAWALDWSNVLAYKVIKP